MKSIKATRAHLALKEALREFTEASRRLETIAGELHRADAGQTPQARTRAVETLVVLDRQLSEARQRIGALAAEVFEDVVANRDTLPPPAVHPTQVRS